MPVLKEMKGSRPEGSCGTGHKQEKTLYSSQSGEKEVTGKANVTVCAVEDRNEGAHH